ncbi:hypothetical protein AAFF_G00339480 [Aldrovandia affinis]|uniref:SWIM-type zinc finger 7 associated protein 1 n=1 Tax=Aldrovandia affinis TaxID=143900 RepID=A0AAD7WPF7_9TELE|nr:hypothetical protein AAFF_G00339480 [Aldrovandia affinis]
MADILALVFRHNNAQPRDLKNLSFASGPDRNTLPCMIVGERCGIKTSLLFLTAVTAAAELGVRVLFLTPSPIQSLSGPLKDSLANLDPDGLKKIKFMYPRSQEELLQDVASLHECVRGPAGPPSLLIVDGLEHYLGAGGRGPTAARGEDQSAAAHVAALLADTAAFLTQKLEERGEACAPCRVIVSFDVEWQGHTPPGDPSAQDPLLSVLDRYFSVRCTLDRDRNPAAPAPAAAGEPGDVWQIYFSGVGIADGHTSAQEDGSVLGQQWRLAIRPNGAMEFSPVSAESLASM